MAPKSFIVFLFLLLIATSLHAEESYPFSVESVRNGKEHVVLAINKGPAPVSVKVRLTEAENLGSDRTWPVIMVVRPYSKLPLARLFSADTTHGYRFRYQSIYQLGDYSALHDPNALYSMPYEDEKTFLITQAPNGPITTHTEPHSHNAVDIAMPEGTPVLASRDGIVIEAVGHHVYGGKEDGLRGKANRVRVLHDDGTIASYLHLTPNGIAVRVGQLVEDGDLIGYAGSTGYSSGPHLHFSVNKTMRTNDGFSNISVPINFYVGNPAITFQAQKGMMITANYSTPISTPGTIPTRIDATSPSGTMHPVVDAEQKSIGNPATAESRNQRGDQQALLWQRLFKGYPVWMWLGSLLCVWYVLFKIADGMINRRKQREIEKIRRLLNGG
jgi:murein DD-endopeptidase MepM/ murein hydrolase activator NlpD